MIVHLIFVGLISFYQDNDGVRALLLDALGPQKASDRMEIPSHQAFVAVSKNDNNADCPDEAGLNPATGSPKFCSWLLRHEDVTVMKAEGDASGPFCDSSQSDCPAVLSDKHLVPEHLALQGECLEAKPIGCPIAGRMLVPSKKLKGLSLCDSDAIDFYPLRGVSVGLKPKPIAEVMWAELNSQEDYVELQLNKFGSLTKGRTIKIMLSAKNSVNIVVGNLSQVAHEGCSVSCPNKGPDHHFEMYYGLAGQSLSPDRRPVPHACCRCGSIPAMPDWLKLVLIDLDAFEDQTSSSVVKKGLNERVICPMSSF